MNKKKSLITALLLVVVAGLSIAAGTFAYFQWTTGAEGGTSVNVTIEMGGITMHIEPETTEFVGLYPTAHCENNVRYGDALVTIVNNTGTLAIPSFKLKVRVTDKDGNGVPKSALEHINYAVVPIETTKSGDIPVKGTTGSYSCSNVPVVDDAADSGNLLTNATMPLDTRFNFGSVSENGSFTHVPQVDDESLGFGFSTTTGYLPRQYYIGDSEPTGFYKGDVNGITFRGEAYTTSYQYFRVYVWIDEGYTSTIVGNTVSDPLQNAKIEITWSEESMVQQVSGESNVEPVLAAGLYDNEDNLVKTWQELLDENDITVVDNVITASNRELTGKLVIAEGITEIGSYAFGHDAIPVTNISSIVISSSVEKIGSSAFSWSPLTSVMFVPGSKLMIIEDHAFLASSLSKLVIPASVITLKSNVFSNNNQLREVEFEQNSQLTTIESGVFQYCTLLNTIKYNETMEEWNAINKGDYWNSGVLATKVICSDGEVAL